MNLRRALRDRKLTVTAAAERLKMSQPQLSGYLGGHRGFSLQTLLRFGRRLDVSLDDLVRDVDAEYTRLAMVRRYPPLEADLELMDVVTGFETIRRDSPAEAQAVATMLRARMLGPLGVPATAESGAAPSAGATATKTRKPVRAPRRGRAAQG